MTIKKEGYKPRLIDDKLDIYLKIFGAVHITGPKWCGKTWTGLQHANSVSYLSEENTRNLALINPRNIFSSQKPQLLDEWQLAPNLWDAVRNSCDEDNQKGKYILTGSTTLKKQEQKEIFHSGTGRIADFAMETMSLYESGKSSGKCSITDMLNNKVNEGPHEEMSLDELADQIVRGGWPQNLEVEQKYISIIPREYLESIINKDVHQNQEHKFNTDKMRLLISSLARNESTLVSNNTLIKDISDFSNSSELNYDKNSIVRYLNALSDLYLLKNTKAFNINYRSSARVGKTVKRHFVDPSLVCAALHLTPQKLLNDLKTFGYLFESLVARDLRIYMNCLNGDLYHFRDNASGQEIDAILEFEDGEYAACEIKLSHRGIEEGIVSLSKFQQNVKKKPTFMCILVGFYPAITKDPKTGIYIVPVNALRP